MEQCLHSTGTFERGQYRYSRIEVIIVRRRKRVERRRGEKDV